MLPGMDIRRALLASAGLAFAMAAFPPGATGQTVTLNQGGKDVRITIGGEAELPADFPKDIALPQPYAVVRVHRSGADTTVEVETAATSVDAAAATFRAGMRTAGWTAATVRRPATGTAQAWEKDGRALVAWIAPAPAGVRMQLELRAVRPATLPAPAAESR